jgi:Tol biopolymer transport system component
MNADGTDRRQLTSDPAKEFMPRWSPDGRTILFHSDRSGSHDLYLLEVPEN